MGSTAEVKVFYGYAWQEHSEDGHGEIDAHLELVETIEAEFGVDYGRHGHSDYAARHLAIYSTVQTGEWTEAIDLSTLPPVDPAWREQLDRGLAEFNIPAPQDVPRWWAVVRYG